MFVDEVEFVVSSGKGGAGAVSFFRAKGIPKGGPDGGEGGRGGDVIVSSSSQKNTLIDYRHIPGLKATAGGKGGDQNKTGRSGKDLIVKVPPGTLVYDAESGVLLADLDKPGVEIVVAKGGRGGKGNLFFANSVRQTPTRAQPGEPGKTVRLRLELKLLADVGIIGLPSVGKSSLIGCVSSCRPEIAEYHFTTLVPNLGVVERFPGFPFVVADMPGLIEGAHEGKGLGTRFLKHIQRTAVLLHVLDGTRPDIIEDWRTVRNELETYDPALARRPEIVAINKVDALEDFGENPEVLKAIDWFKSQRRYCLPISAATGVGIEPLLRLLARAVKRTRAVSVRPSGT